MLKPELSEKNQYWIPRLRYYELKNFVLQYYDWLKQYRDALSVTTTHILDPDRAKTGTVSDPVPKYVEAMKYWSDRMDMIHKAVKETTPMINQQKFLFYAVTKDKSYNTLELEKGYVPVSRAEWYNLYRKFFWILDKIRE